MDNKIVRLHHEVKGWMYTVTFMGEYYFAQVGNTGVVMSFYAQDTTGKAQQSAALLYFRTELQVRG